MSKAKELQAENAQLRGQLADANYSLNMWKRTADMRQVTITGYQKTITEQKETFDKHLIKAATAMAEEGARIIGELTRKTELAVVAAERDAVAQALRYTLDNLTLNK